MNNGSFGSQADATASSALRLLYPRKQTFASIAADVCFVPLSAVSRCKKVRVHSARNAVKTFGLWSHHEITHGLGNDARMRAHRIVSGVSDAHDRQVFHVVF